MSRGYLPILILCGLGLWWLLGGESSHEDVTGAEPQRRVPLQSGPSFEETDESSVEALRSPAPALTATSDPPRYVGPTNAELPPGYSYPTDRPFTPDDWQLLGPVGERGPLPGSELETKYAGSREHEEWLGLAATVGVRVSGKVVEIGRALKEEGFYELVKIPTDDTGEPFENWMGGVSDQLPLWTLTGGRGVPPGLVMVTWIPWPEYPELYDLRDEWHFLNKKAQAAK